MLDFKSQNTTARVAGFLYLGVVLTGIFTLMYVPSRLFASDNASVLYENIASSQMLLRFEIIGGLLCYFFSFFYRWCFTNY